jgi:2-phospho-L-lactate guanylyltransferase
MIYCVIPTKPHAEAKSRLAPVLTDSQRADLSRWLLRRTVRLARQVIGPVVVVSRDPAILTQAETQGAWGLPEVSTGLNLALTQAAHFARDQGATALLVLPTDLPRLTAATHLLVIAPCRRRTGTNALLMRPPNLIPFLFGPDSFAAHCAAARAAGVEPLIYRADSIAFDLDTPEDWELGIGNEEMRKLGNEGTGDWSLANRPIC